jgi:uncharacterized membrane protein
MSSIITVGMTILLGAMYCWTKRINGLYFFGRTAAAELRASEEGRAITRQYLTAVAAVTAAAAVLAATAGYFGHRSLSVASWLIEFVAFLLIFSRANGQVRRLTQGRGAAEREPVIQVALLEQPTYWIPSLVAILLPLILSVGALGVAVFVSAHGSSWSAGWTAWTNSMDGQGYAGILGFSTGILVAGVGTLLLFRGAARLRTRMAQYTVRACISLEWVGATLLLATIVSSLLGITLSKELGRGIMLAGMVISIGVLVWNQSRSKRFVPPPVEVGGDDRWRWGLFYVDRNDPALFVQSRCGAGYTLNYGKMLAWPISLGLVAYLIGVLFFLPPHH